MPPVGWLSLHHHWWAQDRWAGHQQHKFMTTASNINFGNVVAGSSSLPAGVNTTYFYARFVGYLIPSLTGVHTIGVNSKDGCNLYIAGQPVFTPNLSAVQTAHSTLTYTQSGQIDLTAGVHYPIVLEWQKSVNSGGNNYECQLAWTVPGGSIALIPTGNLSDSDSSVTGVLDGTWWNGTSGLWYPAGNGIIDFASSVHPNKVLDNINDGSTYARVKSTALTSGNIDPTRPGVLMKGSIPPSLNGGFTDTATTTSITWSWPANTAVYRADGTVTVIGSGSQAITGLVSGRAYYFYPVYNEAAAALKFIGSSNVSFPSVVGYTGDGTTGYVSTTTGVSQPGNFSVECWINTTSSSVQPLFDLSAPQVIGTAGNKSFMMWFQGSTITANALLGSSVITTIASVSATTQLNDGNTHHIVLTWDNTAHACNVYVDGVLQTNGSSPASAFTVLFGSVYWHIGGVNGKTGWTLTSNTFATAAISNAAYYNAVLSLAQVQTHYQAMLNISVAQYNTVVTADSPVYWWQLDETSGTTAADSAGSNTGTYKGTVTLNVSNAAYGAAGSPALAWVSTSYLTAQASVLQGNIPLTSGSLSATPSSGGSGGGGGTGGGGGGGGCFSPNTKVVTQRGDVRFDELTLEDKVRTAKGTWRPIAKILIHDWHYPMLNMGHEELITYKHRVRDGYEWQRGADIFGGSRPYDGEVWNLHVATDEPEGLCFSPITEHSYQLANGWIVHNSLYVGK